VSTIFKEVPYANITGSSLLARVSSEPFKKKYHQVLWIYRWKALHSFWWQRCCFHHNRWDPYVSQRNQWEYQVLHKKRPVLLSHILLQLHQKQRWSRNKQSLWLTLVAKDLPVSSEDPLEARWKRTCWWDYLSDCQTQKSTASWAHGPGWLANQWSTESAATGCR